jgi:MFS family permease
METSASHVQRPNVALSPDDNHHSPIQPPQDHPYHHHQHHHYPLEYSHGGGGGVQIDYYGLALVFLAPALGGFLYGYDIGATSFVLAMLRSSRDPDTWWHDFPMFEQGLLVSALSLGALIGSHIVLVYLAKSIGRRKEMRVAASLYIVGAMLNIMSGTVLANTPVGPHGFGIGIVTLIAGRLFYGAGVGFIMHGAPTYMAEMSPSRVRGTVVSAKETVIVFGIVVGMLMGDLMSDYPDNWTGTLPCFV